MESLKEQITQNYKLIDQRLSGLEKLINDSKMQAEIDLKKEAYRKENEALRKQVDELVARLNTLEGREPYVIPKVTANPVAQQSAPKASKPADPPSSSQARDAASVSASAVTPDQPAPAKDAKKAKEAKPKAKGEAKGGKQQPQAENKPIDVSRLDLRVGRIISAKRHPDADALYVEEIDLGEEKPRTVISGLVRFVPLEEMQNRLVVCLCNLKPAKMRGILSEAMVMCASTPDKVEILTPPEGSVPGDRVTFEGFPGEPDPQLNPKHKIWEQVAPDLSTGADLVAKYKGSAFEVKGKGVVKSTTLAQVPIK